MHQVEPGKTYIGKVRAISSERDTLALQLRLASILASTTLQAPGLSASAIMCIRTLRDPLPGSLHLQAHSSRPPQAWEQAVEAALGRLIQHAARPAREAVPANAEAVIFADQAELLACLASDWCEGSAVTRWWWQGLFRGADMARAVPSAWLDAPAYVPAALQHLAEKGKAAAFVSVLSPNDARSLVQRVMHSFALHELQSVTASLQAPLPWAEVEPIVERPSAPLLERRGEGGSTGRTEPVSKRALVAPRVAPWWRWVPESSVSGLSFEQQLLLGIGLMLQRAPLVARTSSFAQDVLHWQQAARARDLPDAFHAPVMEVFASNGEWTTESTLPGIVRARGIETVVAHPDTPVDTEEGTGGLHKSGSVRDDHETPLPVVMEGGANDFQYSGSVRDEHKAPLPAPAASAASQATPYEMSLFEAHLETGFGGVFYLINLGIFLGLYGDFTTPAQPGLPLSIWDFVALLWQQFARDKIQTDPLWALLARLAGRGVQDAPGKDFVPPGSWRVPVEWLAAFPEAGVWYSSVEGGRLRVRHHAQFLLLDLPLDRGDPRQQLEREMQAYSGVASFELLPGDFPGESSGVSSLQRWLDWLIPYVRVRLCRALAVFNAGDLAHILCEHHAGIFMTATHLDIVFALAELPIEVRLAGLDRNPGWVPAAGKYITFHFE